MVLWCQFLADQDGRDALVSADLLSMAMWEPSALQRVRGALLEGEEPKATEGKGAAIARAERILHLIDSGSGPSAARLERRRTAPSREQR